MTRPGYGLRHHAFARGTRIKPVANHVRGLRRANSLDGRSLPPEGGSHPERHIRALSKPEVFYPRCYDRRMMLLDRVLPEAVQNGQHA